MWTEPPRVICSLELGPYLTLTGAKLAELVKEVIETRGSYEFISELGYFDGDTVSFGQVSWYEADVHIRVVPDLEGSPFFKCEETYTGTIYFASHRWPGSNLPNDSFWDGDEDCRQMIIRHVKQLRDDVKAACHV